jgi:hypothetical protein
MRCISASYQRGTNGPSGLQLGERIVQPPKLGISLADTRFGFGEGRFESGQNPIPTLLPIDGEAAYRR